MDTLPAPQPPPGPAAADGLATGPPAAAAPHLPADLTGPAGSPPEVAVVDASADASGKAAADPYGDAAGRAQASALAWHQALVDQLCRPGALPADDSVAPARQAAEPVRQLHTHISSLLLAGDRVYKLKKPVRLDFVDFSSLATRHQACLDELRLNRRTAPELYLQVLPVLATPQGAVVQGAPLLGRTAAQAPPPAQPGSPDAQPPDAPAAAAPPPPGAVLDWAVQMQRFDSRQGLDQLAQSGQLRPDQLARLAAVVAAFHRAQPRAPAAYGQPDEVRRWARDNLQALHALLGAEPLLQARLAALARWTELRGAALAPLMAARRSQGQVRELHGDLHLANVVWHQGAPRLFDALEFNAAWRHLDTVGDWAFLFMDLQAHGLQDAAWALASAVAEASDDHAGLPLLHWWAVYRALVRAKVAWLGPDPTMRRAGLQRYLALAEALAAAQPLHPASRPKPWLVLTMGLSGSGKSALAAALAARLGGVCLRSDVERKRLFGLAATDRAPDALGLYTAQATQRTYHRLQCLAQALLAAGFSVVVDAASLRRSERLAFAALAGRCGARHRLLLCHASDTVLRQRIGQRQQAGQDASDATLDVLARQQQFTEWPGADEAAHTLRVDTQAAPAEVLAQAWAGLGGGVWRAA